MANPMNEALGVLLSATKNGAKNGVNGNGLRKIRDVPNYRDTVRYSQIDDQLRQQTWTVDENNYLNLDTKEKVELHQRILYEAGTVKTKVILGITIILGWRMFHH